MLDCFFKKGKSQFFPEIGSHKKKKKKKKKEEEEIGLILVP